MDNGNGIRQIAPIERFLSARDRDVLNPNTMRDWVLANERMAHVLTQKHYPYQFVFARNGGHVDRATREQTLPEALEYVPRGYKSK
jgi:iron(III)-enterobactin esterase